MKTLPMRILYYKQAGVPIVVELERGTRERDALKRFNELMEHENPLMGELQQDWGGPNRKLLKVFIGEI